MDWKRKFLTLLFSCLKWELGQPRSPWWHVLPSLYCCILPSTLHFCIFSFAKPIEGRWEDTNLHVLLNNLCPYPLSYLSIRVTLLHILEGLSQRCIRKCYLYFEVQLQYKSASFLLLLLLMFIYTRNLFLSETGRCYLVFQSLNHKVLGHSLFWER